MNLPNLEHLKASDLGLPEVALWPELWEIVRRGIARSRPDWEMPLLACHAVGGDPSTALPGAVALICLQRSIILVDDLLDQDPRGIHHLHGVGATANLAVALQAAALSVIKQAKLDACSRATILECLAQIAMSTANGQRLDVHNYSDEASYWQVIRAKSTPFYGGSLQVGAFFGGATKEIAGRLHEIGCLLGEIIQIYDDLNDALESPTNPDWVQGRNNLLIRYALTANHPEREEFRSLLPDIADQQLLNRAQRILIRCGAVSYCAYHIIRRYRAGRYLTQETPLLDPAPILDLLNRHVDPIIELLKETDAETPFSSCTL